MPDGPPPASRTLPSWGWWALLAGALTLPLFVAPTLAELLHWRINSVITRMMMLGVVVVLLFWLGLPSPRKLWSSLGTTPVRSMAKAIAITVVVCALYSVVLILFGVESLRSLEEFKNPHRLVLGLLTGLAVSLIEEPIFRRQLLDKFSAGRHAVLGAVGSSALYALVHYVRPDRVPRQDSYSLADSLAVYRDIASNLVEPFHDPVPGLGLFLLGLLLCAIVRRGGLAWTVGIHAGVVYYVKADSCFLHWNLDENVRHPWFGTFPVKYDAWLFCIVAASLLLAVVALPGRGARVPSSAR